MTASSEEPRTRQHIRGRRHQLLWSALGLCTMGIICQLQNLQEFTNGLNAGSFLSRQKKQDHFLGGDLYIPSIEYPTDDGDGNSGHSRGPSVWEELDCSRPTKEADWEWYNTDRNNKTSSNEKRLLIAISAGYDKYADLLHYSAHLAKVYTHLHNSSAAVVLQGNSLTLKGCSPPPIYTTLNKIRLLFHAVDHRAEYDYVLLLDADALIVNPLVDITSLLPSQYLVAAQPVRQGESPTPPPPFRVNAGATLWNLHHPKITQVAMQWFQDAKTAIVKGDYRGDERYLHGALENYGKSIYLLQDREFSFREGTIIQHHLQHGTLKWEDRKSKFQKAALQVCQSVVPPGTCEAVPARDYPTE